MELVINGNVVEVPKSVRTVSELIDHLELQSPIIIVEHNEVILKKEEQQTTQLSPKDKLEFVQFVGGG